MAVCPFAKFTANAFSPSSHASIERLSTMASTQTFRATSITNTHRVVSVKQQRQNRAVLVRVASEPDAATNVGVKLPATHVSASQNALKQIETINAQGINST